MPVTWRGAAFAAPLARLLGAVRKVREGLSVKITQNATEKSGALSMSDNWRSRTITQGAARSPNRAMLRAVGFGDGDFQKAIVGVANGHSTMNPCNAGIQPLVDRAVTAVKGAGAMPQVFGFPTVTDGIGMGTEGMKYSLVSREVIADSIETAVNGQLMDGVLCVGGCDKNMPGAMMAMARSNLPGRFV